MTITRISILAFALAASCSERAPAAQPSSAKPPAPPSPADAGTPPPAAAAAPSMVRIEATRYVREAKPKAPAFDIAAFEIDRTEVSNAKYRECVAAGACKPAAFEDPKSASNLKTGKHENADAYRPHAGDDQPAIGVTWKDAESYCRWRGARLPTEAEWEVAARGDTGRKYPWGDEPPTCDRAVFAPNPEQLERCRPATAPVDSLPEGATPAGVLHLAGNADEWVSDWFEKKPFARAGANPRGPAKGKEKVLKGGAWNGPAVSLAATSRSPLAPDARYHFVGFRCARDAK